MTCKQRRLLLRFCSSLTAAILRATVLAALFTLASTTLLEGCHKAVKIGQGPIFGNDPPLNSDYRQELHYLESSGKLPSTARLRVEQEIEKAQNQFGVPSTLLWCEFFQLSRLDPLKNADASGAPEAPRTRGLGQLTSLALDEINEDTDHFDDRTSETLNYSLKPHRLPISLEYKAGRSRQPRTSYFALPTAASASAAYLNNRYAELRRALDRQRILYDPQVLWMYAAAAYEKGMRVVFALLTHQRLSGGQDPLTEALTDPKRAYALLARKEPLEQALRELLPEPQRGKYAEDLAKDMDALLSCAVPEATLL